eukprot:581463-Pelagomonas_calceolata.AAC.1
MGGLNALPALPGNCSALCCTFPCYYSSTLSSKSIDARVVKRRRLKEILPSKRFGDGSVRWESSKTLSKN